MSAEERMTSYEPSEPALLAIESLNLAFREVVNAIEESPGSYGVSIDPRSKAIAITKLEEALMWASRGIASGSRVAGDRFCEG